VTKNNWSSEFETEIVDYVSKNDGRVSYEFAVAFSQINNPIHKELILKSFVNSTGNRHIFYSRIERISWLDATPAMKKIWQSTNVSNLELEYLAYPLGISGYIPVLDYLASNPNGSTHDNPYRKNVDFFNFLTNQDLKPIQMKSWLLNNKPGLSYDPERKKFNYSDIVDSDEI
jgi:hypothetical protein